MKKQSLLNKLAVVAFITSPVLYSRLQAVPCGTTGAPAACSALSCDLRGGVPNPNYSVAAVGTEDRGRRWNTPPSYSAVYNTGPGYIGGGTEVAPGGGGCAEKYTGTFCIEGPTIVGKDTNGECEGPPDPPPER